MSLGPIPKVGAHDFRHPLRARETADCSAAYLKKPPVPRAQRKLGKVGSSGSLLREKQFFGEAPPNLPGAPGGCVIRKLSQGRRPSSQENENRPAGWNAAAYRRSASVENFSRVNHLINERESADNQAFEWGPMRQVWTSAANYASKHILEHERQVDGQRAPWDRDDNMISLMAEAPPRRRKNTLSNELLAAERDRLSEQVQLPKLLGRRSVLKRENEQTCMGSLG